MTRPAWRSRPPGTAGISPAPSQASEPWRSLLAQTLDSGPPSIAVIVRVWGHSNQAEATLPSGSDRPPCRNRFRHHRQVREPCGDVDDIAAVAVEALTGDGHEGRVYEVTGPQSLTLAEVATMLSEISGRGGSLEIGPGERPPDVGIFGDVDEVEVPMSVAALTCGGEARYLSSCLTIWSSSTGSSRHWRIRAGEASSTG